MTLGLKDPYAGGVLKPDVHSRLVADLENYARAAGILPRWVMTTMKHTCSAEEVAWTMRFKFHTPEGRAGLVLLGRDLDPPAEDRMSAIAGCLTRNFTRARVLTLNALLANANAGDVPDETCLLVPNFYAEKMFTGPQSSWKIQVLLDVLIHRHVAGLQTVLAITDMAAMHKECGEALMRHVGKHYEIISL